MGGGRLMKQLSVEPNMASGDIALVHGVLLSQMAGIAVIL